MQFALTTENILSVVHYRDFQFKQNIDFTRFHCDCSRVEKKHILIKYAPNRPLAALPVLGTYPGESDAFSDQLRNWQVILA